MSVPVGRQIIDGVTIALLMCNLAIVYKLYVREPARILVKGENSEQTTFFKILILKPDLDYALAREVAQVVDGASKDFNRDPDFILAIMHVESRFNPKATSPVGAQGLMQVRPFWLKVMGAEGDDLFDPRTNVRRGLQIYNSYEQMLKSRELALTAYNRGSWKVEEDLRNERDPRNGYAKEVLDVYERLKLMQ